MKVGPSDKNEFGHSDGWAKTLHVKVGVGVAQVVDYLAQAVNLPSWVTDFCQEILVAGTCYMRAVGLGEATSLVSFIWLRPSHLTWEQFDTDWQYLQAEVDQLADCLEGSGGSE